MLVRRETPADVPTIRAVTTAAFAPPGQPDALLADATPADAVLADATPAEAVLVDELRASTAWLPRFSLVATTPGGAVIGHVLCTRGRIETAPALALGPLSVRPDHQRRGAGQALVHTALGAADSLDEPLVVLLGDPLYYSRFGFRLAEEFGIIPQRPEWKPHFQVRTLTTFTPALRGRFAYPEPFARI
jgi:putative acetyltransferase